MRDVWTEIGASVEANLGAEDDASLWRTVVDTVLAHAEYLCAGASSRHSIVSTVGCCSHWLRPHQTRWTADGGFAWPTGYGGPRFSRTGLPQHDWEVQFEWDPSLRVWVPAGRPLRTRTTQPLEFRVSVPARTSKHEQAAVCTIWRPGSPAAPQEPMTQFYGFRCKDTAWSCTASSGLDWPYDLVAEQESAD